tara:strand:- start:6050 stop:6307 length:258 start_codon:yes stop_codon:yes gene_type:complete
MLVSTVSLTSLGALGMTSPHVLADELAEREYDFLDYLGDLVSVDGEWVDPLAMQDVNEIETGDTDSNESAQNDNPGVEDATEGKK